MKASQPVTRILVTEEPTNLEREHELSVRRLLGRLPEPFEPFTDLLT